MIHKYKSNGYNIVLDVNSGAVHVVDDVTYDMLDNVEPPFEDECPQEIIEKFSRFYNKEEVVGSYHELKELYKENLIFTEDEDYKQLSKVAVASPIKSMCLNIAHDCNLRCEYCFAAKGDFGTGRKLMSYETGKAALDFLIEKSKDRENLEVDFFGGEPLMNFEVVKKLVAYGRDLEKKYNKRIHFTITTNGLLLDDEKIDFINKEMYNVVLSIDGRKEVNDKFRVRADGTGCYDQILPKYLKLVKNRGDGEYYVRGTFTKANKDFTNDVVALYNAGFDQISIEPVIGDGHFEYSLTEEDIPAVYREYDRLTKTILEMENEGKKFNFFHFMIDLDQGPCVVKRMRGCGCGNEYVCVTPDGDIYPCHQFVGKTEFIMGNLKNGTFNNEMKKVFSNAHIYSKPDCRQCWARFYCSGGCNANNYEHNGDIRKSYRIACEFEKKRVECAIMLKIARMEKLEKEKLESENA